MLRVKKGSGALATIAAMTGWLNAPCEEGFGHQVVARNGYQVARNGYRVARNGYRAFSKGARTAKGPLHGKISPRCMLEWPVFGKIGALCMF